MEERLQKYMARCGVDSRRKCEELIASGRVSVNGDIVTEPGVRIDPSRDRVKVDQRLLRLEKHAYYLHYKVKGVATTVSDDLGRKTVMDFIPPLPERIYPVGRLDMESEGLLVLTNDGDLANYLTHPAHGVVKTYRVVAEGRIPQETLETLADKGIRLGPVLVKPTRVEFDRYDNDNTILHISVAEGINREVRRIFAALGHEVKKLLRTHLGPLSLAGMKRGGLRPLAPREIAVLQQGMAGLEPEREAELFPKGSAKGRKPAGPRGRLRNEKPPRQGKPDPAAAGKYAAGNHPTGANPAGRGKVVVDDWTKGKRTLRPRKGKVGAAKTGFAAESADKGGKRRGGTTDRGDKRPVTGGKVAKPFKAKQSARASGKAPAKPPVKGKAKLSRTGAPKPVGHPLMAKASTAGKSSNHE